LRIAEEILNLLADLNQSHDKEKSDQITLLSSAAFARLKQISRGLAQYISDHVPCPQSLNIQVVGTVGDDLGSIHVAPGISLDETGYSPELRRMLVYEIPFCLSISFRFQQSECISGELRLTARDHPDATMLLESIKEHNAELARSINAGHLDSYVEFGGARTEFLRFTWTASTTSYSVVTHFNGDSRPDDLERQLAVLLEVVSVAAQDLLVF